VEGATIHYAGRKVGELVSPTELNAASIGWDGDAIGSSLSHDLSLPSESTAHSYRKYIVQESEHVRILSDLYIRTFH
jgi:hypothetical protein